MAEEKKKEKTYKDMVKAVFCNAAGDEFMEAWRLSVGDRPSYFHGNSSEDTAFNEGQRSGYLDIRNTIEEIRKNG